MKAKAKIKILIADDHPLMRQGLATLLNADLGLQIVGEAKNGAEAAEKAAELKPDVGSSARGEPAAALESTP